MQFKELERKQEVKKLMTLFQKNSSKMLDELQKGAKILIQQNKDGYKIYSEIAKKIK